MERHLLKEWIRNNLNVTFVRSSGPGGQNVNKLNTKAIARLTLEKIPFLTEGQRRRVRLRLHTRINDRDELVLSSQEHRTQLANKKAVTERMVHLVLFALRREKRRIPTRPTRSSVEKRFRDKRRLSEKKRLRSNDYFER
jgi:ribosome-associated protein